MVNIRIKEINKKRLDKLAIKNESYNKVIQGLLDKEDKVIYQFGEIEIKKGQPVILRRKDGEIITGFAYEPEKFDKLASKLLLPSKCVLAISMYDLENKRSFFQKMSEIPMKFLNIGLNILEGEIESITPLQI